MSSRPAASRARTRICALLATALVATLPALGLGAVPSSSAADPTLSHVASASSAGNRKAHRVRIPATVAAGDTLVLFVTTNSISGTLGAPAGWTLLQSKDGKATRGRAWTKRATAADANALVTVTSSAYMKSTMSVSAYRSAGGTSAVTASASATVATAGTSHTTPAVAVAQAGSWLVSSWSEKSSTTLTWTRPAGSTQRTAPAATGSGKVSSLVADSGAPVATGTAAGRVARTSAAGGSTQLFSVVVSPGVATAPVNKPPVASFTSSCTALTCEFDATASADPDGDPLTYAWSFGDGATGAGATTSRTYAAGGAKTVTLTVGDGTTSTQTSRTVTPVAPTPPAAGPGHTGLVPETPRTDMPKISKGEIWDIEVVGKRVFVAGTFSSIQNQRSGNTTTYTRPGLASYNLDTGLVDATFAPTFGSGSVDAVEASPDGTRLYISGNFGSVGGVTRKGIARIDMTTGAAITSFTANTDARANELAVSDTTVYAGGRFTKVNGVSRTSLVAVDALTGAVDTGFVNNLSIGIGVNGALGVQRLMLTHDYSKLLVVHTGRRVAGEERVGIALISTATKQLLPWRTRLWDDNLQFVGGVQRIYGADIAPDDSYFVVTSGSGGDRPPINDTAVAYSFDGEDNVEPRWVSRAFDSVYSVAISEKAVYIGGHFAWNESPSAPDPWPGKDDIGYGTGQGLSAYALGDGVVSREHLGALDPADGKALEWNPGSNSYEGNKAMVVTPRGLITGGDATTQGGYNVGRLAFFDLAGVPASNGVETAITEPISGRVLSSGKEFELKGTASAPSGVNRVQVEVQNRSSKQWLQDDLTTWGASNTINANLDTPGATATGWSLPLTVTGNVKLFSRARTYASNGSYDNTKDTKKFETFGLEDAPPSVTISGPASGLLSTRTFKVAGTTTDDRGVVALSMTIRDGNNRYLQDDGSIGSTYNSFRIVPDVPGALSTTWSREVTVPGEGTWKAQVRASDTSGQSSLDTTDRTWNVFENGQAPTVSISSPAAVVPPTAPQPITVEPGKPITFTGSATDDKQISSIDIALLNNSTQEFLTVDGTFGHDNALNLYRLKSNVDQKSYNWSYTTPFDLTPGSYQFAVIATDSDGIMTPQSMWAIAVLNAQVAGDAPPKATLAAPGIQPPGQSLGLDLAGNATDDKGVDQVRVTLRDADTSRYLKPDGTLSATYATVPATLASPGATSTGWSLPVTLPTKGTWNVTAVAVDTAGQQDFSNANATARYPVYPGDTPPTFNLGLLAPTNGTTFQDGRVFVSGRAEDDQSMAKVEVAIIDAAGRYLSGSGAFGAESWRTAFLTSPGTPGSNFSWTSPVVPPGDYTVKVRATDQNGLVTTDPPVRSVSVVHPPGNAKPVAVLKKSCDANVCTYDARGSTDESVATLSYSWSFGNGNGTGPLPTRTYTSPGTYTVTLTATDEWGAVSDPVSTTVEIAEPAGNAAPEPVINTPTCSGLTCNFSAVGTTDPNTGDAITYSWSFGDPASALKNAAAGPATSHAFTAGGTYTVSLTARDGWGKERTITRDVTVAAP